MSRLPCADLKVTCRQQLGLWTGRALNVFALDFDRHGMALQVDRPIAPGTYLLLNIEAEQLAVDSLEAVVHNCREWSEGFRCGIQFRHALNIPDEVPLRSALCEIEQRLTEILNTRQHFQ